MVEQVVTINGAQLADKHTYYEAYPWIGPSRATVIIRGDIAQEFEKRYSSPISKYSEIEVNVDFSRNGERVKECQDLSVSPGHMIGSITSLDRIISPKVEV